MRWIAELIGYPGDCGGLLVSGGNMANIVCFLAARAAHGRLGRARARDRRRGGRRLRVYASAETHTWIQKAADLSGLGTDAIRWIPTDAGSAWTSPRCGGRSTTDVAAGDVPFMVVGTAGSVSTGAVDPLPRDRRALQGARLWFHVDGAYGGFAAAVPDAPADLRALGLADSVAVDPHKWLYAPLEAGCALVRDRSALRARVRLPPAVLPLRRAARRTTSTTARRTRAASARSRCGWRCGRSAPPATAR